MQYGEIWHWLFFESFLGSTELVKLLYNFEEWNTVMNQVFWLFNNIRVYTNAD